MFFPSVARVLLSAGFAGPARAKRAVQRTPLAVIHGEPPPPASVPLSATVLTRDSRRHLAAVLDALSWCAEVVVLDTGSTDDTLAIARSFPNVRVHRLTWPFDGFGAARREAVRLARYDWILSVDSDEVVTADLAWEIAALPLDVATVYTIPFRNFYQGRHITTCGWAPDRHERLFCRGDTNFCTSAVHERVQLEGVTIVELQHPIDHHSFAALPDFLRKTNAYAQLFARQNEGRRRASVPQAVGRGTWAFFKSYILRRGVLQGADGLVVSVYNAQTVFWKYMMLREANRRRSE